MEGEFFTSEDDGEVESSHWEALRNLLPAYRCITRVQLGDGQSTDFWEDIWEGGVPMSNAFPALHSHVVKIGTTVEETVEQGILPFLAPLLSSQATRELQALEELLADLILTSEEDARTSCFESVNHGLHTGHQFRTTLSVICSSSSGRVIPLPVSSSLVGSWCLM
ncbi:hypothetical protein SETIT_9G481500v2 [Setaria italica]|uniref:Uncharacterized protein n=1 Tax=Setaria italica TaxID=4555 RepID=A0A368STS9_SETIT|nr:hypothetical protein SETIT_9G481500v2 [Setaria italica]